MTLALAPLAPRRGELGSEQGLWPSSTLCSRGDGFDNPLDVALGETSAASSINDDRAVTDDLIDELGRPRITLSREPPR